MADDRMNDGRWLLTMVSDHCRIHGIDIRKPFLKFFGGKSADDQRPTAIDHQPALLQPDHSIPVDFNFIFSLQEMNNFPGFLFSYTREILYKIAAGKGFWTDEI